MKLFKECTETGRISRRRDELTSLVIIKIGGDGEPIGEVRLLNSLVLRGISHPKHSFDERRTSNILRVY